MENVRYEGVHSVSGIQLETERIANCTVRNTGIGGELDTSWEHEPKTNKTLTSEDKQ